MKLEDVEKVIHHLKEKAEDEVQDLAGANTSYHTGLIDGYDKSLRLLGRIPRVSS